MKLTGFAAVLGFFAARVYSDAVSMRERQFLGRHPELEAKFYEEDSAQNRGQSFLPTRSRIPTLRS
jgi:hypothetical protein